MPIAGPVKPVKSVSHAPLTDPLDRSPIKQMMSSPHSRQTCDSQNSSNNPNNTVCTSNTTSRPHNNNNNNNNGGGSKLAAVKARQLERHRQESLRIAICPEAAGRRAAFWLEQWDRGSRAMRLRILEAFIILHSSSNTNRMEKDLGDSSMLLFTRITAWFRLTCKLNYSMHTILASISLFVRGVRYLTCLMEVGGAETLIDTLATSSLSTEDRREIALLLLYIANAGRVYREMLCDGEGINLLLKAMQREENTEVLDLLAAFFLVLGEGSSKKLTYLVQTGLVKMILDKESTTEAALQAARTLRTCQSSRDKLYSDSLARDVLEDNGTVPVVGLDSNSSPESVSLLLEALFSLLFHDDLRLRVEGTELLTMVAKNIQFTGPILTRCFDVVDEDRLAIEAEDNLSAVMTVRRHQIAFGSTAVNILLIESDCEARKKLALDIIARRSAHFSLLKYLRLLESGYSASVLDCCRALQLLCRGALIQERGGHSASVSLEKVANHICEAVGGTLYNVLLYEELTEAEAASIVRSVTSSVSRM